MPTSTNAEKSLAIAAFTQEMTLAGLMRCQSLGIQVNPAVMGTTRGALLSIYKQAGFPNPESMLQAVEVQLADGLTKMEQNLLIAR